MSKQDTSINEKQGVFRVGVRVPPFWPEKPEIWFAQIEGQFHISNITSDLTKYYYIISNLEPKYAAEVEDIISKPPTENKYLYLKTKLIERVSKSREERIRQLITTEELGDRKPSQFLRHLQSLAGSEVPQEFLKTIWASRLPSNIQTIVASQTTSALDEVALLADKIAEIVPTAHNVNSVASNNRDSTSSELHDNSDILKGMQQQITDLAQQVAALSTTQHRFRQRLQPSGQFCPRTRSIPTQNYNGICYYHYKFGMNAQNCRKPCNYRLQGNGHSSQ